MASLPCLFQSAVPDFQVVISDWFLQVIHAKQKLKNLHLKKKKKFLLESLIRTVIAFLWYNICLKWSPIPYKENTSLTMVLFAFVRFSLSVCFQTVFVVEGCLNSSFFIIRAVGQDLFSHCPYSTASRYSFTHSFTRSKIILEKLTDQMRMLSKEMFKLPAVIVY